MVVKAIVKNLTLNNYHNIHLMQFFLSCQQPTITDKNLALILQVT